MNKLKEILKYIFYVSIVWTILVGLIVFSFQKNIHIKNLQIQTLGFVIGELTKEPCSKGD